MKNLKEYIICIEELNKDLGVVGNNSYIYESDQEIEVGIEAPNQTVSVTNIDKEALFSEFDNNNWKNFIINEYLNALRYFDITSELQDDSNSKLNQDGMIPSQKLFMIENDIEYFKEMLYVKRYIINN
jgi:hypothetical protein